MGQPEETKDRIKAGDDPKFEVAGHTVTTNEVHALQLGASGVFAGVAFSNGMVEEALGVTSLLFLTAFGLRGLPESVSKKKIPIAWKTKRHEPWWFTTSYTFFFVIGTLLA